MEDCVPCEVRTGKDGEIDGLHTIIRHDQLFNSPGRRRLLLGYAGNSYMDKKERKRHKF